MNYKLIRDKLYVVLLAKYNGKPQPTYIELAKVTGLTRQTVSTRLKKLIKDEMVYIDDEGIMYIANDLNIDVNKLNNYLDNELVFDPIELKRLLFPREGPQSRLADGKELGMARDTIYAVTHSVVYGIIYEDKIRYVGTTKHYKERIRQHIKKRPFLSEDNFIILMEAADDRYAHEREFINKLQPEWNEV